MMSLEEKRPWTNVALFSCILVLTAVALEFGFVFVDPWGLPSPPKLKFEVYEFPSLAGISLSCETSPLITKIDLGTKTGECLATLKSEMSRCEGFVPMRSFGNKIQCAKPEQAACETGGVQSMGLFKGDISCANSTSETDLGPPAVRIRADDV